MALMILLVSVQVLLFTHCQVTAQNNCVNGDLRLETPARSDTAEGIEAFAQYCLHGTWSRICASTQGRWYLNQVACRQLGYQEPGSVSKGGGSSESTSTPLFVTLDCPESGVSNLQECGPMRVNVCPEIRATHLQVECLKGCTNGKVRLVNELIATDREGRVEVCVNGRWGTVQTRQQRELAEAVCSNISLSLESFTVCLGTQYGYRESKPVYSCDVSGGMLTCRDEGNDDHNMDLGVVCGPLEDNISCNRTNEVFRLVGGSIYREGRVEVCVDGRWGTVCNNNQEGIAGAVCFEIGFPAEGAQRVNPETQILHELAGKSYYCYSNSTCVEMHCDLSTSLRVKCMSYQEIVTRETFCAGNQEGQYRLVNSSSPYNGSLEVCMDGSWKTVCGNKQQDEMLLTQARTVCSELGFSHGVRHYKLVSEVGDAFCCLVNKTDTIACEHCKSSCNHRIQIECETCQQVTQQHTLSVCPTPQPSPTVMCSGCSQAIQQTVTVKHCPTSIALEPQLSSSRLFVTSFIRSMYVNVSDRPATSRDYRGSMHVSDRPLEKPSSDNQGCSSSQVTMDINQGHSLLSNKTECFDGIITPLGAVSGILGALLVATVVGWIVTCAIYSKRSATLKRRKFLTNPGSTEGNPIQPLENHIYMYSVPTESTPTCRDNSGQDYSEMDSNYDTIGNDRLDTYDVIDHSQRNSNTQVKPANLTPVRDETNKKEDDFYDAEEHTYAVVNKKKTKKTSEDGEGEREEPPDYEMAVPGEISWGVMAEETDK